jgi:hypothetical protein
MPHAGQCGALNISGAVALAFARQRYSKLSADGTRVVPGAKPQRIDVDQIETAMAFLKKLQKTKKPTVGSGTLKHHAEDWAKEAGGCRYISRGALIAGALAMGLTTRRCQYGGDILVAVSTRDLAAIVASTQAQRRERIALRDSVMPGIDCR